MNHPGRPPSPDPAKQTAGSEAGQASANVANAGETPNPAAPHDLTLIPPRPAGALPNLASPRPDAELQNGTRPPADATLVRSDIPRPIASTSIAQTFSDYDLLEVIAKGGMGVVYKARQRKLNRIVAVKMILAGQFADQVDIDRFFAEAEAAAHLRHPNIVAIHEVGEHDGRHFFSMDYIEGKSLADLIREHPLASQRAAEFVRTLAQTMHYAHEQGILHRDLKPGNVLIDRSGHPLITDFGLAKRVNSGSQLTMDGSVLGTPSYMSPEQAAGRSDVDARSDIYALGAILYELLTGRPPFLAATPFETIKRVLENEPVSVRALNPQIPRDLETICAKCLLKEPGKRYATAHELADELRRFLAGEPILARPIGPLSRAWRWCRRNRVVAALIGTAAVLLLATLTAITVGYIQTSAALRLSDESFRQARGVVDELFTRVSENTLLNQPGMQPLRQELLAKTLDYYQKFLSQRRDDPALQDELALAYFRVGLITQEIEGPDRAMPYYQEALQLQQRLVAERPTDKQRLEDLGNTLNAIGVSWGRSQQLDKALESYREASVVRQRLADQFPNDLNAQRHLASTWMNIGLIEKERNAFHEASEKLKQAQQLRLLALRSEPKHALLRRDLGMGHYNLAQLAMTQHDYVSAESGFVAAIHCFQELSQDDPQDLNNQYRLATCHRLLGDLKLHLEDAETALAFYSQASERMETLARLNTNVPEYQAVLAGLYKNLGRLELARERPDQALTALLKARNILKPLADEGARLPRYRQDYAFTLRDLGQLQASQGQADAARENLRDSATRFKQLTQEFPEHADYQAHLRESQAALTEFEQANRE